MAGHSDVVVEVLLSYLPLIAYVFGCIVMEEGHHLLEDEVHLQFYSLEMTMPNSSSQYDYKLLDFWKFFD